MTTRTPDHAAYVELQTRKRLQVAILGLDAAAARRYACAVTEGVAHHFLKRYPDNVWVGKAILAGCGLAKGTLAEWEHAEVLAGIRTMAHRTGRYTGAVNRPFHCAAVAAAWCVSRDAHRALYWVIIWAANCEKPADQIAAIGRHCEALEVLLSAAA